MDKSKLEYFLSTAYHLNFTKAVEECHITQATMSRQIAALETEIGVPLFERTHHGVALTPAGKRLFNSATSYLDQYNDMISDCRRAYHNRMQKLRVGLGPYEYLLAMEPLRLLRQQYPTLEIGCQLHTHKIMNSRYNNGPIDVGFCSEISAHAARALEFLPIYRQPWQVAARVDNPFWSLPRSQQAQLKGQAVITLYCDRMEEVRPFCIKNGFQQASFCETNFLEPQIAMLQAGFGVALLPPFVKPVLPPSLRMEDVLARPFAPRLVIAYDHRSSNPSIQPFINICRAYFHC